MYLNCRLRRNLKRVILAVFYATSMAESLIKETSFQSVGPSLINYGGKQRAEVGGKCEDCIFCLKLRAVFGFVETNKRKPYVGIGFV